MDPTLFGRLAALTGRMTQGFVDHAAARVQIYTDDPCTVIRGTVTSVKHVISCMVMLWLILGRGLSFHKGRWGKTVDWIGYSITTDEECITVAIKEGFMNDYRKEVATLLKLRRIFVNELTSFTGRTNHVACLLYAWRPFISDLWVRSTIVAGRALVFGLSKYLRR